VLFILLTNHPVLQAQEKKTPEYYFEKGEGALSKEQYITAQAHFTECLRLNTRFAEAYRLRAVAREYLNEREKALNDYNIYLDLVPGDAEALFSRAMLRFESDQYLLAHKDFLTLLTLPKGDTKTIFFGQEKFNNSNLKIFTAHSSKNDYIYNYLGLTDIKLKRYDAALGWLDSAIKIEPANPTYRINHGLAKLEKKDSNGALIDFKEALRLDPESSLAIHNIAIIKSNSGEINASEQLLSEAIDKNKNMPYPYAARAYHRFLKNDLTGALADYDEVIKIEPSTENYVSRGLVKEKQKDLKSAATDFAKAIELDDKNLKAWVSHGNIMSRLEKWQDAIDDYTVAISHNSRYALAYYNRAIANQSSGKLTSACSDLKMAEKLGIKLDVRVSDKICK